MQSSPWKNLGNDLAIVWGNEQNPDTVITYKNTVVIVVPHDNPSAYRSMTAINELPSNVQESARTLATYATL